MATSPRRAGIGPPSLTGNRSRSARQELGRRAAARQVLDGAVVRLNLNLVVGKRDRDEQARLGRVARASAKLLAGPRCACHAVVAVGDVEGRNLPKRRDQCRRVFRARAPHCVLHTVWCREVVERSTRGHSTADVIDIRAGVIGQEHHARLSAKLDDVTGAIVFLVSSRALVLLDDVVLVLVNRKAPGQPGLLVVTHLEPVEVQRRRFFLNQRRDLAELLEILASALVHRATHTDRRREAGRFRTWSHAGN